MRAILSGAHVQFLDPEGGFHHFLISRRGAYPRISSHPSTSEQYGVKEGRILQTILIGTNSDNRTWFQLEGAPWDPHGSIGNIINHSLDAVIYFITRRNIGPLGTTSYTDKNPLRLDTPAPPEKSCPLPCRRSTFTTSSTAPSKVTTTIAGVASRLSGFFDGRHTSLLV